MSAKLPNGSKVFLGTVLGAVKAVSAITNANPAVASSTGHGLANGDFFLLKSGMNKLNERVFRAAAVATNALNIEGRDTTDTNDYPAGSGAGSLQLVQTWVQLTQVLSLTTSGGEPGEATFGYLEDDYDQSLPTRAAPSKFNFTIADDPTLAGQIAALDASEKRKQIPIRVVLANGSVLTYFGTIFINPTPTMEKDAPMALSGVLSLSGPPVRYAA